MRRFAKKVARYALPAFGFLCLMLTGGCLLALIPEKYFTIEAPLGVRYDAQTNVVERLVMKKWFVVHGSVICEPSVSKCYDTHVYLDRTNQSTIRYKSLERLVSRDPYGEKWLSEDWLFRPLLTDIPGISWLPKRRHLAEP
jgi:ribulose-5-phosphate 4-epimerase/fuculose-1-phosphate aldolase